MTKIVPIKFRTAGKQYHFNAGELELTPGQPVIVETDRGRALGTVVTAPQAVAEGGAPDNLKNVIRIATEDDIALAESSASREREAYRFCMERIRSRNMEMKLVRAEYLFDGSKIIFYFTADGRVDFRELVKDLAHYFHTRIEMRQIGVRDEAKLIGGIGVCGRALCCCTFLTDFVPVSVKMAKEQGLALNPNKISGQCGRLLCCLNYEYKTYLSLKQGMPKCGRRIRVEGQEGEVVGQKVLEQSVTVRVEDNQQIDVPVTKVQVVENQSRETSEGDTPPARSRGRQAGRPRKNVPAKAAAGECGVKDEKDGAASPGKGAARRGRKPAQKEAQPAADRQQPSRRRPRRKNRPKQRPNKNTPPGDKS